jgi:putative transposase
MPNNVYAEINLHITWHTKMSSPVISDAVSLHLYRYLRERILQTPEVKFHAAGGTENHVHLAVSIPPTLEISRWIGEVKGASAHHINHRVVNRKLLEWQTGYGIVSFGTRDLGWVVGYISGEKQHHAAGKTYERLERIACQEARERAAETPTLPIQP